MTAPEPEPEPEALPGAERSAGRRAASIAGRIALVVGALVGTGFLLAGAVDELDWGEVRSALGSLSDAELLALATAWLVWLACQGLQTASLVPGLPVRRGILAFLGPSAVASVVPGPSDLPLRYAMLTGWGRTTTEAGLAVAAGGIFNIGIKLVLPVVAAVGLVVSGVPLEGAWRTLVVIAGVVGIGVLVVAAALRSEATTAKLGRALDPIWRAAMRLLRREADGELADRLVASRAEALGLLHDRWPIATWGTVLAAGARVVLLILCLRFTGVPESAIGWTGIFVAFAFVQGLTAVPILPGNVGVSELAYISMITSVTGASAINEVTAGVLLFRMLTWLLVIAAGIVALVVWRIGSRAR
ncbi:MAG: lysylphosphatidylglycerol synthase domain-containing protein [Actinomycetota bacterium]